ncbi:major facilitator superfamily domain-containing protein [Mycena epipterygia]|nr:major facilitator superfamily domain-containing protein [Mycena epipterygia]
MEHDTKDVDIERIDVSHTNKAVDYHQSQLGPKPIRKHFFSPLDSGYADAVNRDAEIGRAVKHKIDLVVLPLIICSTNNNKWTVALSIFYVGYCLLEMPANILQRHIGANRFFFMSLTFWGIASLFVVYAKGYAGLLVLRVLMGIGETGYYGLLAFGLVRAKTSVLDGSQFLFLIIMAFAILFFLPSFPFSATFLTPRERAIAQARLNRDHKPQSHGGMTGWNGFKVIIADVNAWLFMLVYASFNVGVATVSYFLPTASQSSLRLTVAPYVVGWLMVLFQAWHSDRTGNRGYHIMLSCAISFIGKAYFAMFLVIGGNYSLFPLVIEHVSPTSKRGVGTVFIVSISNCVSIASPQVYFDPEDPYRKGHAISAGRRNAKYMAELAADEKKVLEETLEIWDTDPRYVFTT